MFYDMHVHSTFSVDGQSSLAEYAALLDSSKGTIGFAEHVDFLPECGSYDYMDYQGYTAAVRSFREKGCDFHAGAEIDYVKLVETDIFKHLSKYGYEYTICSIHMVDGLSVSDRKFPPAKADVNYLLGIVEKYYGELEYGIKTGMFDVVGHVGVFIRYLSEEAKSDRRITGMIREAELEIAKLCARSDMIVEVNTSGLFSPSACTLPGNDFLKHYIDHGGRLICLGSDAHNTGDVARGFKEAGMMLKALGFGYLTLPWDREHHIKLD